MDEKIRNISQLKEPVIVVSQDLTPTETASLDKNKIKGFTTDRGGRTSHTAIIARAMGIPAVVALNNVTLDIASGDLLIVDGNSGIVIINPDNETIKKYSILGENFNFYEKKLLSEIKNLPTETKDGHEITLHANIELPEEAATITQYGASGIGLFRTEWLYSDSYLLPSEKEHFDIYRKVVSLARGKNVTIRTLDIGGDKLGPEEKEIAIEKNPFLGCRAIRLSLQNTNIFESQLRGILRASHYGNISIMFPMISSIDEVKQAKNILEHVKSSMRAKKIPFNENIKIGIMIEIPSSAIMADILMKDIDFCSIGTNDLIQYTLAVDRGNEIVSKLYQEFHPAIVRFIHHVITEGKKVGKRVSLCGEMGADPFAVPLLVGLGLESLSASASILPHIKKVIRSISYDETKELGEKCLKLKTEKEINAEMHAFYNRKMQDQIKNLY